MIRQPQVGCIWFQPVQVFRAAFLSRGPVGTVSCVKTWAILVDGSCGDVKLGKTSAFTWHSVWFCMEGIKRHQVFLQEVCIGLPWNHFHFALKCLETFQILSQQRPRWQIASNNNNKDIIETPPHFDLWDQDQTAKSLATQLTSSPHPTYSEQALHS